MVGLAPADRARWLRFALKIAALWATILGALAFAVTDDIDGLWWGLRITGSLTVVTGLLGLVRHRSGEGRGRDGDRGEGSTYAPSRALTGAVRILLGSAVVIATL